MSHVSLRLTRVTKQSATSGLSYVKIELLHHISRQLLESKNFATLAESLMKRSTVKIPAMDFGTLHESDAPDMYSATYDFELFRVCFVVNPMRSFLGCSPDRRVYDSTLNEMGLLEVKCTMNESVSDVAYLRVVGEGRQL